MSHRISVYVLIILALLDEVLFYIFPLWRKEQIFHSKIYEIGVLAKKIRNWFLYCLKYIVI